MVSVQSAPPRLQTRVSIDPQMGDFYDWFRQIPPEYRCRELVAFARFGFGVAALKAGLGQIVAPFVAVTPGAGGSASAGSCATATEDNDGDAAIRASGFMSPERMICGDLPPDV